MKKKKILFVEDEKNLRETLGESLEKNNFQVQEAIDGEDALNCFRENHNSYDLVLLDIILPKKNGLDVLAEIKKINKNMPVILLTNLSSLQNIQKALDLGVKNYLVKSEYSLQEIIDRIKEII